MSFEKTVEQHWAPDASGEILRRIDEGLVELGKNLDALTYDDIVAVDEFHIRGREATAELAELAAVCAADRVLDVGSGVGGPSRFLAATRGCHVDGIDLTTEYCDVATALAERIGLADKTTYRQANALTLPFDDASFDLVWTQHISMNIEDKDRMFSEMYRVLKPGGRAAIYDPIGGSGDPLDLPVPWAREKSMSFLIDSRATRDRLERVGFRIGTWRDVSDASVAWFRKNAAAAKDLGPEPLGLHLLLGPDWPTMARNMVANIAAGRIAVIQAIAHKS